MVKAAIFDMDGVIVDSTPYHVQAWNLFCTKHNLQPPNKEFWQKMFGKSTSDYLEVLFGRKLSLNDIEKYSKEKDTIYLEVYKESIQPVDGLINFLNELVSNKIAIAMATSEPASVAHLILKKTNTEKYFRVIVDRSQVQHPKPNPEIYTKAARLIEEDPSVCVVFEDTIVGVQAAKSAGMKVVGITTTYSKEALRDVDLVIEDFLTLTFNEIDRL